MNVSYLAKEFQYELIERANKRYLSFLALKYALIHITINNHVMKKREQKKKDHRSMYTSIVLFVDN